MSIRQPDYLHFLEGFESNTDWCHQAQTNDKRPERLNQNIQVKSGEGSEYKTILTIWYSIENTIQQYSDENQKDNTSA